MKFTCKTNYSEIFLHEALCDAERLQALSHDNAPALSVAKEAVAVARALLVEKLAEKSQAFLGKLERDGERNREQASRMAAEWEQEQRDKVSA